jgi:putative mRNA 3-end processing factor
MNPDEDPLLKVTELGLYCERGDFFVDPWRPVERAVVTHAHADHLCRGCGSYLLARPGLSVAQSRLDRTVAITTVPYGEPILINGVQISLHPAGHILGSAQVRLEHAGRVWVVSGDYKVERDNTCAPFEPIRCHLFISECTFALPIYRWASPMDIFRDIVAWWQANRASGRASLLYAYSLGKAQRILAGLADIVREQDGWPGPIYTDGAVEIMNQAYRAEGIDLPVTAHVAEAGAAVDWSTALIVAPPSAHGSPWSRRFGPVSSAFASGWMRIRGTRRRRAVDRGFVLSDHADWPGLLASIDATGAETVWLTHGYTAVVTRWLREQGKDAHQVATRYEGESDIATETATIPSDITGAAEPTEPV